jgi:5-methylcytosine-specific restriction endonuclease McrA
MLLTTLVLNKSWMPDRVVSWEDAICLTFAGRAEVVETYTEHQVHSANRAFAVPSVIRMVTGRVQRTPHVRLNRQHLLHRDNYTCQYCGVTVNLQTMTYDHVMPRSRGGKTSWENIVAACGPCNRKKSDRTPEEARMQLRVKPVPLRRDQAFYASVQKNPAWKTWIGSSEN